MDDEKKYWVAFSVFPGIGPVRFKLLRDYFGSAKAAWEAPAGKLKEIGLGEKLTAKFAEFRQTFDLAGYLTQLEKLHVAVITLVDSKYPKLLAEVADAPFVLYVLGKKGERPIDLARTLAVVGTRKVTKYGVEVTQRLVTELVSYGFTIVSGLAYGVDAVAHQAALDADGQTIAVLGCGVDLIAPPSNARLYHKIAEAGRGAIVSEMPLSLRPNKGLFPARNRIISGLSLGVLVTEGADDSGALITARYAAEQGREVFAIPGPITSPYSKAPAKLIKNGAKLVESASDILDELGFSPTSFTKFQHGRKISELTEKVRQDLTEEEKRIVECLEKERIHIDEIVRVAGLTTAVVSATLTVLEMKNIVKDYGDKVYGIVV